MSVTNNDVSSPLLPRPSRRQKKKEKEKQGGEQREARVGIGLYAAFHSNHRVYSHTEEAAPGGWPDIKPAAVFFRPPVFLAQALAKHSGRRRRGKKNYDGLALGLHDGVR
jgi:hypothetical protein